MLGTIGTQSAAAFIHILVSGRLIHIPYSPITGILFVQGYIILIPKTADH